MRNHTPVLSPESITLLDIVPGSTVVDGTVGSGGHAAALAAALDYRGVLLCIDRDPVALGEARTALDADGTAARRTLTLHFAQASYREVRSVLTAFGCREADAILLDLGFSSDTLARGRGFSVRPEARREPLDMRYDPGEACPTAADILRRADARTLARIFREYGEERFAIRIAHAIVLARRRRPLATVGDLIDVVVRAVPPAARRGARHVATKTFQALRIAVNRELDHLAAFLGELPTALSPAGRAALITFHSLEDRAVKQAFRAWEREERGTVLTPKPTVPGVAEVQRNPRSRSAKLRAFQRSPYEEKG